MNSTFIDTLLISLVLFGLLRNWRQVFTSCCNGRKENRSFSSPCHEQKYTTSLAARLQHTWLPGCFFTGLSNYLPVVSWEHFERCVLKLRQLGMAALHLPCQLPLPALSIFVSSVRINKGLLCIPSLCAVTVTITSGLIRTPDPQRHRQGETLFEQHRICFL